MNHTFPKSERLYGVKSIERLHAWGTSFVAYPFRVVFFFANDEDESIPVRTMVSVSKKKFKKAVDRNRIKRLMREAYRQNKNKLVEFVCKNDLRLHLAFQYISAEIMPFSEVNKRMEKALDRLIKNIAENTGGTDENG